MGSVVTAAFGRRFPFLIKMLVCLDVADIHDLLV